MPIIICVYRELEHSELALINSELRVGTMRTSQRAVMLCGIGVILGGTRGTHTPIFWSGGYCTPHFLQAVTRKITTQTQSFSTEQDINCQTQTNIARPWSRIDLLLGVLL